MILIFLPMKSDVFKQIIGHKSILNFLRQSIMADKISHCYVFAGLKSVGKKTVAKHFIQSVVCEKGDQAPCNSCVNCRNFVKDIYPDFYQIDLLEGKKNISIEQIRKAISEFEQSSFSGGYKIALINNAHLLSLSASNALLKTLEEPSGKSLIILITEYLTKLPVTIKSRSQIVNFNLVGEEDILEQFLKSGIDKDLASEIAAISQGRPGAAIKYIKNRRLLNSHKQTVNELLDLFNCSINERFAYFEKKFAVKKTFQEKIFLAEEILDKLLFLSRDLLLVRSCGLPCISYDFVIDKIKELGKEYSQLKFIEFIDCINKAKNYLRSNANPLLVMENLVLSM
ncbi:hypothetical protein KAI52_01420 [Candidatus Parcubacteria bacterium]|nr:hypothetical protein [Candidatus Parcubacteria bacterium]